MCQEHYNKNIEIITKNLTLIIKVSIFKDTINHLSLTHGN